MFEEVEMDFPIVSVIVITYNSEEFILDTLQSIFDQSYQNIELIISDDCSSDNTLELANDWLMHHATRFCNVIILNSACNTGISANLNRGINNSNGIWIKPIAGDDLLLPDCIIDNVQYALKNSSDVIFSIRKRFISENSVIKIIGQSKPSIFNEPFITAQQQYRLSLWKIGCPPNTLFYSKRMLEDIGGFDEEFKLIEDWPMNMRITGAGYKIDYMHKETFLYRIHESSVFHKGMKQRILNNWGIYHEFPVYIKYVFPKIHPIDRIVLILKNKFERLLFNSIFNYRNLFNLFLIRIVLFPFEKYLAIRQEKIVKKVKREIGKAKLVYTN